MPWPVAGRALREDRLERQIAVTRDTVLSDMRSELLSFNTAGTEVGAAIDPGSALVPLRLKTGAAPSFISTTTVFEMPRDVCCQNLPLRRSSRGQFTAIYLSRQKASDMSIPGG